jgi:hypothetical protein
MKTNIVLKLTYEQHCQLWPFVKKIVEKYDKEESCPHIILAELTPIGGDKLEAKLFLGKQAAQITKMWDEETGVFDSSDGSTTSAPKRRKGR